MLLPPFQPETSLCKTFSQNTGSALNFHLSLAARSFSFQSVMSFQLLWPDRSIV